MDENAILTYILVFLAVFVPYIAVSLLVNSPRPSADASKMSLPPFFRLAWRHISSVASALGGGLRARRPAAYARLDRLALISGYSLTAELIYAGQIFAMSAGAIVLGIGAFVLTAKPGFALVAALLGGVLGWIYPPMVVERRAQARRKEIIRSLPFAIDLIASAMSAGQEFNSAVRNYVNVGGDGALSKEFGMFLKRIELGQGRNDSLNEMASHIQTSEFSTFVGAVIHGTEIGASIIETLLIQGEDMRRARFNLAERKAARAPALMIFPIALFILPAVFTVVLVPVFLKFQAAKGG